MYDGTGRKDTYQLQANGTYGTDQLFGEGSLSNLTFTLTFADSAVWEFLALDGSASQGRIHRIVDRNSNAITFAYSGAGQLTNIVDTLGRNIQVSYNTDGFISAVTDFTGRQVAYTYYQNIQSGGSFGDLKTATSPVVTNTPNGNDFPFGKTVAYTYSKGFGDARLNHNLLTITDALGQTWLRNTYSSVTNPTDINFDRLASQIRGYTNEILSFYYNSQPPIPGDNFAVTKAIVNDRVGNISEYLFDATNRLVRLRHFTGRAVPGLITTETYNRPGLPLRTTDPIFFQTSYQWNADSKPTITIFPNGNIVSNAYELALNPSVSRRFRGNLRAHTSLPGPLGGGQASITETYVYDTTFGGCCGFNFVTQATDGRGNTTLHSYDTRGNLTNTISPIPSITESFDYNAFGQATAQVIPDNGSGYRRRDLLVYYTNGPQAGYLYQQIVDSQTLALTTTFEYDAVGNMVRKIDPRGHDTLETVNALNQIVRQISCETTNGSGIRYTNLIYYDANDNRTRVDVQNINDLGALSTVIPVFTTTYNFDILNLPIRSTQMVNTNHSVTNEIVYDANHKQVLARMGEAASGADPTNTIATIPDERNMLFRETRASGSPKQATVQYDYDPNGNVVRVSHGVESAPSITTSIHDGYDRLTTTTDPSGNVTTRHYDANGNLLSDRLDGELRDVAGSESNIRLKEVNYTYDPMNRRTRTDESFFDPKTQHPIGEGLASTVIIYADTSQVLGEVDANGFTNRIAYDTAGRESLHTDAKGNTVLSVHDANGNEIATTLTDKSDLSGTNRTMTTTYLHDNLDRPLLSVDNHGQTNHVAYDSRNNISSVQDQKGNTTRYEYDGLQRIIVKTRIMTDNGAGDGNTVGTIVTSQTWDDSSRLASQTDDHGNTTSYVYDSLGRVIRTQFANGTSDVSVYDAHNNRVSTTDANSNVVTTVYDQLNRPVTNTVVLGPGVQGPTSERYEYDGMSRLALAQDDLSRVTRAYDSLSHIITETQQPLPGGLTNVVTAVYDGEGNLTRMVYPGGRTVVRGYNTIDALTLVREDPLGTNAIMAAFAYLGSTVEHLDFGNGIRFQPSYDGLHRATNHLYAPIGGGLAVENRFFTWDPNNNKTSDDDRILLPSVPRSFHYDSDNRLIHSDNPKSGQTTDYTLDGVGNRVTVSGTVNPGSYSLAVAPGDFAANRYTGTPFDTRTYDRNGNLLTAGTRQFTYDHHNRLIQFIDASAGGFVNYTYAYDVLGRRTAKIGGGNGVISTNRYFYWQQQEIEEQDGAGLTLATFVWGSGMDEALEMTRNGQSYFFHLDDLDSVRKVTDASGAVVEAYEYDDYGAPHFFDGSRNPLATTQIGNLTLFTGRRYDPETGFYFYRSRYLDPQSGRFISSDSIGVWTDGASLGNAFAYVGNNPESYDDPLGTKKGKGKAALKKLLKKAKEKIKEKIKDKITPKAIVGLDGKLNLCADVGSGDWELSGDIWIGAGTKIAGKFMGISYTKSGTIKKDNDSRLKWFSTKGTCDTGCNSTWLKVGTFSFNSDLPISKKFSAGPLSCEANASFGKCTASIGVNCEADFVKYLVGPLGAKLKTVEKALDIEVEAGASGSLTFGSCWSTDKKPKLVSATACIGAYIRIGKNLDEHP